MNHCDRSGTMKANPSPRSVGDGRIDAAVLEPMVDLVEHLPEAWRDQPAQQARTGRETPVCPNQMLAPRRHFRPIHVPL